MPVVAGRPLPGNQSPLLTQAEADALYATIGVGVHHMRWSDVRRSKGGKIGVSGKGVVAFRADHGVDEFRESVWPVLKAAYMPCGLGVVTDSIEDETFAYQPSSTTWAQLRTMHYEGCEIWSHSRSHLDPDPYGGFSVYEEIVGSREKLEEEYLAPVGWHRPGITPCLTAGYSGDLDTVAEVGDTYAGQLTLATYGLWESARADSHGAYRVLPTDGCEMLTGVSIEESTLSYAEGIVDRAAVYGFGVNLVFHPDRIDTPGYMSLADFTSLVDYVASARDAGDIEVLTPSGLAFADPYSADRLNIIRDGTFEGLTKSGATIGEWACTTDAGITLRTDGGHSGNNYIRFSGTTNLLQQSYYYIGAGGFRNAAFRASAWVRNPTGAAGVVAVMLVTVGSPGGYPGLGQARTVLFTLPETTDWTYIQFPFCTPGETAVESLLTRIARHSSSTGDVDFDDVKIEPV